MCGTYSWLSAKTSNTSTYYVELLFLMTSRMGAHKWDCDAITFSEKEGTFVPSFFFIFPSLRRQLLVDVGHVVY